MKKLILIALIALPVTLLAQIGIKAGINFANVSNASSINNSSRSGFNAGILISAKSKKILGSRTELIFSRQGYSYKSGTTTGNVNLDYLMLPQYLSINITKYFSIQFGGQVAFLLNAKADSSASTTSTPSGNSTLDFFNRFDYGYGGGVEIHPVKGLLIGARVNISLNNLYQDMGNTTPGSTPSFIPKVDVKNNVFQIYTGWAFGGHKK